MAYKRFGMCISTRLLRGLMLRYFQKVIEHRRMELLLGGWHYPVTVDLMTKRVVGDVHEAA